MALWKCCQRYSQETANEHKNTFWTFAYLRVKGSITDYLRREKLQVRGDMLQTQITFVPLIPEFHERIRLRKSHRNLEQLDRLGRDNIERQEYADYAKRTGI